MSKNKQKALETLEKVKEIYDNEGGDLIGEKIFLTRKEAKDSEI